MVQPQLNYVEFYIADGACRDSQGNAMRPVMCFVDIDHNPDSFIVCYQDIFLGVGITTLCCIPIVVVLCVKYCRRKGTDQTTDQTTTQM